MRKFRLHNMLRIAALLLPLLGVSTEALAVCQGASGLPFNCTQSVLAPQPNDLVFGGSTTGAQNGQSVKWTWGQVFTGTTLTSPVIINGTIQSLNTPLAGIYGGTGVANNASITLGGNFTTSGSFPLTFTLSGATTISLPTSGTILGNTLPNGDIYVGNGSNVATAVAVSGDCIISNTGVLTCTKLNAQAVSLGGTLTTTGGNLTLALSGNTSVSLPTSGTLLAVVPNYITGLTLSNDGGTPNSKLDIASGVAADSTNAQMITIGAFVKSTAGAWTSGSGNNGMGNGLTIANSTWYHVCLAYNGGTPDAWFDTSAVCANKPSGVSGALFRRIGSFKTDSSAHIIAMSQFGNQFLWATEAADISTTIGTGAALQTLSIPLGVKTFALWRATVSSASAPVIRVLLTSPDETSQSASAATAQLATQAVSQGIDAQGQTLSNTSSQIRAIASAASTSLVLNTYGWIDLRGQ